MSRRTGRPGGCSGRIFHTQRLSILNNPRTQDDNCWLPPISDGEYIKWAIHVCGDHHPQIVQCSARIIRSKWLVQFGQNYATIPLSSPLSSVRFVCMVILNISNGFESYHVTRASRGRGLRLNNGTSRQFGRATQQRNGQFVRDRVIKYTSSWCWTTASCYITNYHTCSIGFSHSTPQWMVGWIKGPLRKRGA